MHKGFLIMMGVMLISMIVAGAWNSVPVIKDSVHAVLNPSLGRLMDFNVSLGMIIVTAIITLGITLVQKYTTDQETLKALKDEQKIMQQEMKKYKEHPSKLMEMQKKQLEAIPKTFELTLRPLIFTAVPIILFFRWFNDYFTTNSVKIFGFLSWFWAYLILSIIFSAIFRKVFKVY
jgi:uncharacterized membrane protein (DUF106 family)